MEEKYEAKIRGLKQLIIYYKNEVKERDKKIKEKDLIIGMLLDFIRKK